MRAALVLGGAGLVVVLALLADLGWLRRRLRHLRRRLRRRRRHAGRPPPA